jgi:RNA-binding protein 25
MKRRGLEVNLEELKKRETRGEPLEWELLLISKDSETRNQIFQILQQKSEIEMSSKQQEKPEEYLKDIKELSMNPYSFLNQQQESEREKDRVLRKQQKIRRMEKHWKEEESRWKKYEDDHENERIRIKKAEETLSKRKKKLIERDLNYDSEEEKRNMKQNIKRLEELKQIRIKERELDEMIRRKEANRGRNVFEETNNEGESEKDENINKINMSTALVPLTNIPNKEPEQEAKATFVFREYHEEDEDINSLSTPNAQLQLEFETFKATKNLKKAQEHHDEDDENDPYHKKAIKEGFELVDIETEKKIEELKEEIMKERKIEEIKKMEKQKEENERRQEQANLSSQMNEEAQKILEIQKQIFEMMPRGKDELFKYQIQWNVILKNEIIENKIKPWISKKMKDFLGEEEPNLLSAIIKKLNHKSSAYEIQEKVKNVFEEDTDVSILIL